MEVEMTTANGFRQFPRIPTPKDVSGDEERDILLSAALVSNASNGVQFDFKSDLTSLRLYYVYRHWTLNYLLYLFLFMIHFISLFETLGQPREKAVYLGLTTTIELLCITYFIIRLYLRARVTQKYLFWHDPKTLVLIWTIAMSIIDIICFFIFPANKATRFTICLRPLFIVTFTENRQVRRTIRNIRNSLPDIFNVLILFFFSLSIFALIAFKLFNGRKIATVKSFKYFESFWDSLYDLFVLVTTANNPGITMLAYNRSRFYAIFFVAFLVINLYLFMNIILAVIYNRYRNYLKNEVRQILQIRHDSLGKAFDIATKGDEAGMTRDQFCSLMETVYHAKSMFKRWKTDPAILAEILWYLMETNGRVKRSDFVDLGEVMSLEIIIVRKKEAQNRGPACSRFSPFIYNSVCCVYFRNIVKSAYFRYIFDLIIVVNVIVLAFRSHESSEDFFLDTDVELAFLSIYVFEIICKILTYGPVKFITSGWNIFDVFVIGSAFGVWLLLFLQVFSRGHLERIFDIILVLRVLRICKILSNYERFRIIMITVKQLLPSILTYGCLLFIVYYAFSVIGIHLFQGLVYSDPKGCRPSAPNCCPKELEDQGLVFCTINFNSIENSFLLLFDLMVVNDWHSFVHNYEIRVGTKFTRLFFICFHLLCVIIVVNVFTAFVLEAFLLEYDNAFTKTARLDNWMKKIHELGGKKVGKIPPEPKDHKQELIEMDESEELDEFEAYRPQKNHIESIIQVPDLPKYDIHVKQTAEVEILLIRMFKEEIESETPIRG